MMLEMAMRVTLEVRSSYNQNSSLRLLLFAGSLSVDVEVMVGVRSWTSGGSMFIFRQLGDFLISSGNRSMALEDLWRSDMVNSELTTVDVLDIEAIELL